MAEVLNPEVYARALEALEAKVLKAGHAYHPVAGISVGGCCRAIGTPRMGAFRRQAHAHNDKRDSRYGWICVLSASPSRLVSATGRPTALFAHEYAHLLTPGTGHGPAWKKAVASLGHPAEAKR